MACIGGIGLPLEAASAAGDGEIIVSVPGIPGPYCAYGVEKRLLELGGIDDRFELASVQKRPSWPFRTRNRSCRFPVRG